MIAFHFDKRITSSRTDHGFTYEQTFDVKPYFSTPSDFQSWQHLIGPQSKAITFDPATLGTFPVDIGFQDWQTVLHKARYRRSLAIINACGNSIGDHLIGMQAFDLFPQKLPDVEISLFQLNPQRLLPITSQHKYKHLYRLPQPLELLLSYDLVIDLGSLILRPTFNTLPMIDFFLQAFSLNPNDIPPEQKRMKYKIAPRKLAMPKPTLLFHHKASSPIRTMPEAKAIELIEGIIERTDYHVVSATPINYRHERFTDLSQQSQSQSIDDFINIISQVDGIVTVDTCTYHFADAFNVPTVALFTTIKPEYRVKYYPHVRSIMLEEEGGLLLGAHKTNDMLATAYAVKLWDKLSIDEVLNQLEEANHG